MNIPIYLDNNATTPLDLRVREAMLPVFDTHFGNPSSSTHSYGWYAEELVQIAREKVAALINANPDEIIFTSGATESNNLAIKGTIGAAAKSSPLASCRAISVATEHKAVLDPLRALSEKGLNVELLEVSSDASLDTLNFEKTLKLDPLIASVMLANNEIGVIHDIAALARLTEGTNCLLHCDATQAVGKINVDVNTLGIDLLSLSAHKIYGPKGIGALYVRNKQPAIAIEPLIHGGGHEQGLRSGTLNVAAIVGFGKACEIVKHDISEDAVRMKQLAALLFEGLKNNVGGIELNGSKHRIPGNLNLRIDGVDNVRLLGMINTKLAFSLSSACQSESKIPSHVLQALGLSTREQHSSIRIGIGRFTTEEEIAYAIAVLEKAISQIRKNIKKY